MIGIQITDLKDFMEKFLKSSLFDAFLVEEAAVTAAVSYTVDGRINPEFFAQDETENAQALQHGFLPWERLRPLCFAMIKGKRAPLGFKFVLHLMPKEQETLFAQSSASASINAAVLTIRYDGASIMLTSAISHAGFVLDKTPDKLWDAYLLNFLDKNGIRYRLP